MTYNPLRTAESSAVEGSPRDSLYSLNDKEVPQEARDQQNGDAKSLADAARLDAVNSESASLRIYGFKEVSNTNLQAPPGKISIKQRLRELEAFIDTELAAAYSEAASLRMAAMPQEDHTEEKIDDMKKEILQVLENTKHEIKKQFTQQRQDSMRLTEEIKFLREDTTSLQYTLLSLQRKMQELEEEIGD